MSCSSIHSGVKLLYVMIKIRAVVVPRASGGGERGTQKAKRNS